MNNDGGSVEIKRPDSPTTNGVPSLLVDQVDYADRAPWPPAADGSGTLLRRISLTRYGNDPINWLSSIPLVILTQPTNLTAARGSTAVFRVAAAGDGSLGYKWHKGLTPLVDGAEFSGTATPSLVVSGVQPSDAGSYTVDIADAAGSITSVPAILTVLVPPIILINPQSQTVLAGADVLLTVEVTNNATLPITFEWRFQSRPFLTNVVNGVSNSFTMFSAPTNLPPNAAFEVAVQNAAAGYPGFLRARAIITVLPDQDRDGIPDAWEIQYGLNYTNAADALLDFDGDGMSNPAEYRAGTDPTYAASYFKIDEITGTGNSASRSRWCSVP